MNDKNLTYDYICVYDLECNCLPNGHKGPGLKFNETIELPVVFIDVKEARILPDMEFHTYIRTEYEKAITPFCTELTHITDEMSNGKDESGNFKNPTLK